MVLIFKFHCLIKNFTKKHFNLTKNLSIDRPGVKSLKRMVKNDPFSQINHVCAFAIFGNMKQYWKIC